MQVNVGLNDYLLYANLIVTEVHKHEKDLDLNYEIYMYSIDNITDSDGHIICYGKQIDWLIELLSSFISRQLETGQIYSIIGKTEWGAKAQISNKYGIRLKLSVNNGKTYYLDKFRCRVIVSKLKRILSRCIESGMDSNNIAYKQQEKNWS